MPEYHWITEAIWTVEDFLSPAECDGFIARAEEEGFDAAPINSAFGPVMQPDVRNNSRVLVDDSVLASSLWERLCDFSTYSVPNWEMIGLNERFRFYRYDIGQQFDWHLDGSFNRSDRERSFVTLMFYLNDDFGGGATAFHDALIQPRRGTALFFMHRQWHRGEPVTAGRKYVLRTDVMYRLQK